MNTTEVSFLKMFAEEENGEVNFQKLGRLMTLMGINRTKRAQAEKDRVLVTAGENMGIYLQS